MFVINLIFFVLQGLQRKYWGTPRENFEGVLDLCELLGKPVIF